MTNPGRKLPEPAWLKEYLAKLNQPLPHNPSQPLKWDWPELAGTNKWYDKMK